MKEKEKEKYIETTETGGCVASRNQKAKRLSLRLVAAVLYLSQARFGFKTTLAHAPKYQNYPFPYQPKFPALVRILTGDSHISGSHQQLKKMPKERMHPHQGKTTYTD